MLTKVWDFFFHRHKWEIIDRVIITTEENNRKLQIGDRYIFQCKGCGNIKKKDIK